MNYRLHYLMSLIYLHYIICIYYIYTYTYTHIYTLSTISSSKYVLYTSHTYTSILPCNIMRRISYTYFDELSINLISLHYYNFNVQYIITSIISNQGIQYVWIDFATFWLHHSSIDHYIIYIYIKKFIYMNSWICIYISHPQVYYLIIEHVHYSLMNYQLYMYVTLL